MRRILTEDEPLLSQPVFQSIFPWEDSKETFGEHASKLHILSPSFVEALSSDKVEEELRFPLDRHPYKHQTKSWQTMLSDKGKTIVVTSGTGSGKTECFMIPVLQDIASRNEKNCVQAIFLYPLNALMKSQQKRIHAWCNALPDKITYAIYNGDTEKAAKSAKITAPYYPQLITRPQIRETPPQVLFTNPTMLNYMLVRSEDKSILEKSQGKLRWILLDEAHTYTGSSAAELSLQLRRVLDAFGVTIDQVNFAVTSATIGDESKSDTINKLKTFVSQLTGKPFDSIVVIGGKRIIPNINENIAQQAIAELNKKYNSNLTLSHIYKIRESLNNKPVLSAADIAKLVDKSAGKDTVKSLQIVDDLANKVEGLNLDGNTAALLPSRAHYFIRSISGVYVCVNPECERHKTYRLGIGSLTTYQNVNCPICKARMLEVATCPSCGGLIVVGEDSTTKGFRMHTNTIDLEASLFYENTKEDLIESEALMAEDTEPEETEDGYTPFYLAQPASKCLRHHTAESQHIFNLQKGKLEAADPDANPSIVYKSLKHSKTYANLCPHCGNRISQLDYLRVSATQMGRVLSTLILDHAEPMKSNKSEVLYEGKKYITFTDNRQGSARSAMGLNQDVERAWIRASIFHKLADIRIDSVPAGGLTAEEEGIYQYLKSMGSSLPPIMKVKLEELEKKKKGNGTIPPPPEVKWEEITPTLENNVDFQKLYIHLRDARGGTSFEKANVYLRALLVDQFGWIPKRSNTLENMGLIRLVYPDLKRAKCPPLLLRKGCKDEDWQDFLKIAIDYIIRGGRHYMIPGEYKDLLTQNTYTSAIYPKDSELRKNDKPVSKWPSVQVSQSGVVEDQSRLVLLLCAYLGYTDAEDMDNEKIADVNGILVEAWKFIIANVLTCIDPDNNGYMLDLLGPKVHIQLITKGYLCPVDNIILDTIFCGYSPRINGYIGKDNFERFKVTKSFEFPYYPYKIDHPKKQDITNWIDTNFIEQKQAGVFSNIHERVFVQKPIFISAEHSAQQSREDLDKYEKEFNEGSLNILSCSTTMEMGVDIGGISEVVMNNVPPKPANYLQRAGRAGRRNESKALALTFCAPNPIGSFTWQHPDYPITHMTETPLLKLESRQLIQRHVNASIFAAYVADQGGNLRITSQVVDFFTAQDGISLYDKFLNFIDMLIGGQSTTLNDSYNRLVKGTGLENIALSDAAFTTKKDIVSVFNVFSIHLDALEKAIKSLVENGGNKTAIKALDRRKNNFLKTALLSYLAENSFLPSAGIPTGLVECMLGITEDSNYPTMHLSMAISAYAPGSQVVKNEWIYEPAGIRLKTKYDDNSSRYILQNCTHCGYTTIIYGNAKNDCPMCGEHDSMHGIKDLCLSNDQRFTEVVEPAAFSVAWGNKPTRRMNARGPMNFVQPVLLEMEPWQEKTSQAKLTVRCSTPRSEILFYNKGRHGYGYAFCPYCGRMESEVSIDYSKHMLEFHKQLTTGVPCVGGESNGMNVRRHVLLVGRYQTDFVEIKFFDEIGDTVKDAETLYSLGVILSRKLTELLGVNDGEIDFGYNPESHSIFIYDTALGGAGYSPLFREYKDKVLGMAYYSLKVCDCERSCTKCLIDRRSQWYLNYLNRQKALEWLELEFASRTAPDSITSVIHDASTVTTDFATELYNLSRNKDIKAVRIYVDNNFDAWQPEDFHYTRLMAEMGLAGVSVDFILRRKVSVSKCSIPVRATLVSALFQYSFKYCFDTFPGFLKPLLSVTYNNGKQKTYFGENIVTSLSAQWGDGNVFSSMLDFHLSYEDVDVTQLLQDLENGDGSTMFDVRIKEDCELGTFAHQLISLRKDKWAQIKKALSGEKVAIEYSDRYLHTPLGCMILGHLIAGLKEEFGITIKECHILVTKPNESSSYPTQGTNICENFRTSSARNKFLSGCIQHLVGLQPKITDDGYTEHERFLILRSTDEELYIRPDAGIASGWKPFGKENANFLDSDFENDWDLDMKLYNQKKNHSGILYTVSFSKS
jgi:superfamily II DNA/RNA helicase